MTKFSKQELQTLRVALNDMLETSGIEGVAFTLGHCSFHGGEATFKLECLKDGAKSQSQAILEMEAKHHDIDLSKTGKINGQVVKITDYAVKNRKMPWIVSSTQTDAQWKLTVDQVKRVFA